MSDAPEEYDFHEPPEGGTSNSASTDQQQQFNSASDTDSVSILRASSEILGLFASTATCLSRKDHSNHRAEPSLVEVWSQLVEGGPLPPGATQRGGFRWICPSVCDLSRKSLTNT